MEDKNDLWLWFTFFCLWIVSIPVAYKLGRDNEAKFWKNEIPAAMTQLCVQCYNAGKDAR